MISETLMSMVEQALRCWPDIAYKTKPGNRARAAATLVEREQVRSLGNDRYEIGLHRCTATACDCEDRAPFDASGGKLCKHCLAVRMLIKLRSNVGLMDRLREIALGRDRIQLIIERDYDDRERVLAGYRERGRDVRWPAGQRVAVTFEQMVAALEGLGWTLDGLPRKHVRWEYIFSVRTDQAGTRLTAEIWQIKGVTDQAIERRHGERLMERATMELAIV